MNAKLQVAVARSCVWASHPLVRNDRGLRKLIMRGPVAVTRSDGYSNERPTITAGLAVDLIKNVKMKVTAKNQCNLTQIPCVTAIPMIATLQMIATVTNDRE